MFYAPVSPEARQQLSDALKQATERRWYQRVHLRHLSSKGKSVPELVDLFEPCADTIRKDIPRYHAAG